MSETGLPFAISCARKSIGSLPDGTNSNLRRCVPPKAGSETTLGLRTSPADVCHIWRKRGAAAGRAAFAGVEVDDEGLLSRFSLAHARLRHHRLLVFHRCVPAPVHAIAETVANARAKAVLGPPEAHDVLVLFLGGRQLDEVDGAFVPDVAVKRLDPQGRPLLVLLVGVLVAGEIALFLDQAEPLRLLVDEDRELQPFGVQEGAPICSPTPLTM